MLPLDVNGNVFENITYKEISDRHFAYLPHPNGKTEEEVAAMTGPQVIAELIAVGPQYRYVEMLYVFPESDFTIFNFWEGTGP